MKKLFKFLIVLSIGLVLLGGALAYFGERWFNNHLEDIFNQNPERKYDFHLKEVRLNLLGRSISLDDLEINSRNLDSTNRVNGKIRKAIFRKVQLIDLIFKKHLVLDDLEFLDPFFEVQLFSSQKEKDSPGDALQNFFGEILYRGKIKNFILYRGNAEIRLDSIQKGGFYNLGILATELETDSIKVQYPIPFDYKRLVFSFDSLSYQLDKDQNLKLGKMQFDTDLHEFTLKSISLTYAEGLMKYAKSQSVQKDFVEIQIDSLKLTGFAHDIRLYSGLDVRGEKMELFGFILDDFRDKAHPRPKDEDKPMFQGLISRIDFPISLDTLKFTNTTLSYGESVPEKGENWRIHFDDLNGVILNLTTLPENQAKKGTFDIGFSSKLNGLGKMQTKITVPYEKDEFELEVDLRDFPIAKLNDILKPIMNGEITNGHLDRMRLKMKANESQAQVNFIFDYTELKVVLFKKSGKKANKLVSILANLAINNSNLPGEKRYLSPSFIQPRNKFRGPFNLIWQSTKTGMLEVIPGGAAKEILNSNEK
ncbi:uncharacterized protein DUF748 [Algoriphagus boseongensis]|uniref:Uncharacterized protein DUF748 n=1 Tax=Algoriphagus boseongensis TaxID=1442587 RepID=A0A4R6T894_9BACT|nr:DUF748 domain-containing protein [Algoriphagus boseongensis]TDQ18373.1 uncharacterized protein DUF748 [Algoriphagus boseongensis]